MSLRNATHARIGEVATPARERVALLGERHEREPELRGRGLDAEADVGLARGDGRRDGCVRELLARPANDRVGRKLRAREQPLEREPRARAGLAVHEAQSFRDDVVERAHVRRIAARQDQALHAHDERQRDVAPPVEPREQRVGTFVAARDRNMEAREVGAPVEVKGKRLLAAVERDRDAEAPRPRVAQLGEHEVVARGDRKPRALGRRRLAHERHVELVAVRVEQPSRLAARGEEPLARAA